MAQARKETSAGDDTGVSGDAATVQVKIRVTPSLLARLQTAAAERGVAFNREIVIRLIQSFAQDEPVKQIETELEDLHNKLDKMFLLIGINKGLPGHTSSIEKRLRKGRISTRKRSARQADIFRKISIMKEGDDG
jgi:hypothetical protein